VIHTGLWNSVIGTAECGHLTEQDLLFSTTLSASSAIAHCNPAHFSVAHACTDTECESGVWLASMASGEQQATKREVVRCGLEFYDQPCEDLARAMLGCVLVCRGEAGEECRGEVVEVEAYLGGEDRAAHSFGGRRTAANEAMFMVSTRRLVGKEEGVNSFLQPPEALEEQYWCERCVQWQDWRS
jgi:hypothetical protein